MGSCYSHNKQIDNTEKDKKTSKNNFNKSSNTFVKKQKNKPISNAEKDIKTSFSNFNKSSKTYEKNKEVNVEQSNAKICNKCGVVGRHPKDSGCETIRKRKKEDEKVDNPSKISYRKIKKDNDDFIV